MRQVSPAADRLQDFNAGVGSDSGRDSGYLRKMVDRVPWAIFLLLYAPLIYWSGFALKAIRMMDFPSFYVAAHLAFLEGGTPYGFVALDDYATTLDRPLPPYVYPPPSLLAFWPLTFFSLDNAFIVFTIVSHLCLLGSMWLMLRRLLPLSTQPVLQALILCASVVYILYCDAVPATLNLGQINIITLFFICLSMTALYENASAWKVGWPLSIAILLKTYPILLLVLLLVRRRFRALAVTVACYGAFAATAAIVLPTEAWTSWRNEVLPAAVLSKDEVKLFSHSNVSFVWNQSITGFFTKLLGDNVQTEAPVFRPHLTTPMAHIGDAIVIGVTAFFAFCIWRKGGRINGESDDIAASLLMMYLVAPVSWNHHLVFILPATVLVIHLIVTGSVRGKVAVVLALALCFIAWPMNLEAPLLKKHWWSLLASFKFYSVTALWIFFIHRMYRTGFGRTVQTPR